MSNRLSPTAAAISVPALAYVFAFIGQISFLNYYGLDYLSARISTDSLILFGMSFVFSAVFMLLVFIGGSLLSSKVSSSDQHNKKSDEPIFNFIAKFGMLMAFPVMTYQSFESLGILQSTPLAGIVVLLCSIVFGFVAAKILESLIDRRPMVLGSVILTMLFIITASGSGSTIADWKASYKHISDTEVVLFEASDRYVIGEILDGKLTGKYRYASSIDSFEIRELKIPKYRPAD